MKNIKIISIILIIVTLLSFTGCAKKGVNILKQPKDYVGDFYVPKSKKVDDGTLLSVISKINENLFKIESARKTKASDDPTVLECYRISCNGVYMELFQFTDDSIRLKEARESSKYILRSEQGEILKEYHAVANGNFLIMFTSTKDSYGNDRSDVIKQIADYFKTL